MSEQPTAIPPHVQLIQMGTGCWISRLVWTAAKLGIADHLANGSKSAAEMAGPTGTNPHGSALATDNLQKMGYTNVISLDGGWRAIEASGLPLENGKGTAL